MALLSAAIAIFFWVCLAHALLTWRRSKTMEVP
jgi:hypothetical protein